MSDSTVLTNLRQLGLFHHRAGPDRASQGLLHPNLHRLYMCRHLAKVETNIEVALEDTAGMVDKDIKVEPEDKPGKLVQDHKLDKDRKVETVDKAGTLVQDHKLDKAKRVDTDLKLVLEDRAGKVDQGTMVQEATIMDNLSNLLPLPGGETRSLHQFSLGQDPSTPTPWQASQDLQKMLHSTNTRLWITLNS